MWRRALSCPLDCPPSPAGLWNGRTELTSRHVVRERTVGRGTAGLVLALLLAPFLVLISSGTASAVDTLCMPKADETACIASTMGTEPSPIADVDVDPDRSRRHRADGHHR